MRHSHPFFPSAVIACVCLCMAACQNKPQPADLIKENVANAVAQYTLQTDLIEKSGKILNPRTIKEDGSIVYVPIDDWCSGFFPGSMWYLYELTGNEKWETLGEKYTEDLDSVQYLTWHHDVGFMIGSSYLNGLLLGGKEEYKPVIVQTAKSLSTRFRPTAGVIQSWNVDRDRQSERGWESNASKRAKTYAKDMKTLTYPHRPARLFLVVLLSLLSASAARGQITVKGTVMDETNFPVAGANVVLKENTSTGTITDFDGNFTLTVPGESSVLVVSFIGFATKEVTVGKQTELHIVLKEDGVPTSSPETPN